MSRADRMRAAAAKARRSNMLRALERPELRQPSASRQPAVSPTAMAVKTVDPAIRALIDAALARRS